MRQVENDSDGSWRIFSKLGGGYSGYRYVGEVTSNVSLCCIFTTKKLIILTSSAYSFSTQYKASDICKVRT